MPGRLARSALALALLLLATSPGARAAEGWQLEKAVLRGETAPGTGLAFEDFDVSRESGAALVFGALLSGTPPSWGLFRFAGGSVAPLALPGQSAPGAGGATFQVPLTFPSGGAGDHSFASILTGATATHGLFADTGAGLDAVFIEGDSAPGGGTFAPTTYELGIHDRNASGTVVWRSTLAGAPSGSGVFRRAPGSPAAIVVASGDAAPGGGSYAVLDAPTVDDAGAVVFAATLSGGAAAEGLFRHAGGTTTALAFVGDAAPGTGGATLASFLYPVLEPGGATIFLAETSGGSAEGGVFRASTAGALEALLVADQTLPGTGGGTLASITSLPTAGDGGAFAFSATLTGGDAEAGVFLRTAAGAIRPVAFAGETAPGAGGATFASFDYVGLDANGDVAFRSVLSDGRPGLFSARSTAAVPIPRAGAAALAALLLAAALGALRRPGRLVRSACSPST